MNNMELKIYEHYKKDKIYFYPSDMKEKAIESEAIKSLYEQGYITIGIETLGYVIADINF